MEKVSFLAILLLFISPGYAMQQNQGFDHHFLLQKTKISAALRQAINQTDVPVQSNEKSLKNGIILSYGNKQCSESLDTIFWASEKLLIQKDISAVRTHPLYPCFENLNQQAPLTTTLKSGPDARDFTTLLLAKHELDLSQVHTGQKPSLTLFNNAETFLRCFEIFKHAYQQYAGKCIHVDIDCSFSPIPLPDFCKQLCDQHPELRNCANNLFDQIVNVISVFEINGAIVNTDITITMQLLDQAPPFPRSFNPIALQLSPDQQTISNDISSGQKNLHKQIQNLNGSEIAMPYIKDADGQAQYDSFHSLLTHRNIDIVEIGGGRGETNALPHALQQNGLTIRLLNAEPHKPFAEPYINAHKAIGIEDVSVIHKTAQELSAQDIVAYFKKKADVVFASHSFYFILADLHKATQAYVYGAMKDIKDHPLAKYFDMLQEDGIFIVTLQSGAGARLMRNALLGNHGLDVTNQDDKAARLLQSFGNMATFLRHFAFFTQLYEQQCGKKLKLKMHYAMAQVPLGNLAIKLDKKTGGYSIHNPTGNDSDPSWVGLQMMDFYGNWKELQALATQQQPLAIQTQKTFLHILRLFAPGLVYMQHPNITAEINVA
ncbi:MAG: hypothetical protein WCE21_00100 [Candidatus Babeliales bacterium]